MTGDAAGLDKRSNGGNGESDIGLRELIKRKKGGMKGQQMGIRKERIWWV